ncbi:hypothetical protein [Methylobacterium persicinum]|uniref:Uncharacterized protein n=1 Tax=Methylobacterium persicinum TaxID=374426 RepID=A0ABU0HSG5_9HYPH|nr:hypothetical protein [Methylobacterium persicinum]MDQ0445246.1 hypothetical protein [Methylobacterium persicinum]GJE37870.1 hypothetical protein KHHGKMAE_1932 [Methylobacterium persicinum]
MSEETKIVFVTKYALTGGIIEKILVNECDGMATVEWCGGANGVNYFHGRDYHHTREAAIARAEKMRLTKIASHEKSIAKLRKLSFN